MIVFVEVLYRIGGGDKQSRINSRRSFVIERKTFSVVFSKDVDEIGEKNRMVEVSFGAEVSLVKWLMSKLKILIREKVKTGFVESRKGSKRDVTLSVKKNKGGVYLWLLVFSSLFHRGLMCICVPVRDGFVGWKLLLNALRWGLNLNPGASMVEIRHKEGVEKVVAEPVSHEVVAELRI